MRYRSLLLLPLLVALVASMAAPSPADASTLYRWKGKVVHVADGDTIDVDVYGDGTSTPVRIRLTGIQAMEIGDCHAARATRSLKRMVLGKVVRLRAQDPNSKGLMNRPIRQVSFKGSDGRWKDANAAQLRRGHALWLPHGTERFKHEKYASLAAQAADRGRRLWDTDKCGYGPQQGAKLKMWVQWDAEGNDTRNPNGEWIRIQNNSSVTVKLGGWKVRDTALRAYRFPTGTKIPAGETLVVHIGSGTDSALKKYWGLSKPIFENVPFDGTYMGDGAYLFDPEGDLRSWFTYPCVRNCSDPFQGTLQITQVNYDAAGDDRTNPNGEWIVLKNSSSSTAALYGYMLESYPYNYAFTEGTTIPAGGKLTLKVGRGNDTSTTKYWGKPAGILDNGGDVVVVRTFDNIRIHCRAWGTRSC